MVHVSPDASGDDVLNVLGLARPRATLVLNGGTAPLSGSLAERLVAVLAGGVAPLACRERMTVVTGGTDAGIFALYGRGVTTLSAPLVGVAPAGLVHQRRRGDRWSPSDGGLPDRVPLETAHSHHVLVEGDRWGDETPVMLRLVAALDRLGPSAALLVGGGAVSAREVLGHVQAGRPVVILAGSGRLADDVASARTGSAATGVAATLAASALVSIVGLAAGRGAVTTRLSRLLGLVGTVDPPNRRRLSVR